MTITTALFLLVTGIISTFSDIKKRSKTSRYISFYLLGIGTLILSKDYFSDDNGGNPTLVLLMITTLSVHLALGEFLKNKSKFILNFIPIALSFSLLFFPQLSEHRFLDFKIDDVYILLLIAIMSALTPLIIYLVNNFVAKYLIGENKPNSWFNKEKLLLESGFAFAFIGGVTAIGGFLLGELGVLVAATFFLSTALIVRNKLSVSAPILLKTSSTLFLISIAMVLLHQTDFESIDLFKGEVLEGIFMAGFILVLYSFFMNLGQHYEGKKKMFMLFFAVAIPLLTIFFLGFLYTQLERLGGVLTLCAVLISLGVLSLLYGVLKEENSIIGLKMFSLGFIVLIFPYFTPVAHDSMINLEALGISPNAGTESSTADKSYASKLNVPKGQPLSSAVGKWRVNEVVSKIFFELGPPNGRTKGEFRKVEGNFNVKEEISSSVLKIEIPITGISTFNSIRDRSLLEPDFFHEEKYPRLKFEATDFIENGDGYTVKGNFTMLGTEKSVEVLMKLVGIGEKDGKKIMVLWGTSSIDRTEFGMASSAKIGDVVDFYFEVQFEKD